MKYVILGNYGATNIGDEAILAAIIDNIREKDSSAKIVVMSYDPIMTEVMHEVEAVPHFPAGFRSLYRAIFRGQILKTIKALKSANKVIFGGGGLFNDDRLRAIFLWYWQIFLTYRFCKNIVFYRQTVGKLSTGIGRYFTKKACSYCEEIVVRDRESKNLLQYLGVNHVQVMPDPVLEWKFVKRYVKQFYRTAYENGRYRNETDHDNATSDGQSYIVLSLRPWHLKKNNFLDEIADCLADYCRDFEYEIIFVPFQIKIEDDRPMYRLIRSKLQEKVKLQLFRFNYSTTFKGELVRLLEVFLGAERGVAMRLHALIFSYLCRLDTVGIVYSNKVQSFVDYAGFKSVNTRNAESLKELL